MTNSNMVAQLMAHVKEIQGFGADGEAYDMVAKCEAADAFAECVEAWVWSEIGEAAKTLTLLAEIKEV